MWINLSNVWTHVQKADDQEIAWLNDFLTFYDESSRHTGGSGERTLLLHRKFPTGLVPWIEKAAKQDGITVQRIDPRVRPHAEPIEDLIAAAVARGDLDWLRTRKIGKDDRLYQFEAVQAALASGRGIVNAPTGSGKAELVLGLAKTVPINWLFLVHRSNLVNDVANRWSLRGDGSEAVVVSNAEGWHGGSRLSLCTFQTVNRNLDRPEVKRFMKGVQGLLLDECHVVSADTHLRVANNTPNAFYRCGLSGTPLDRGDGKSLLAVGATGPTVYRVTSRELMEAGYVATADVKFTTIDEISNKQSWHAVYRELIVNSKARNSAVLRDAQKCEKPAILFVERLKHGRVLKDALYKVGIEADFAFGEVSGDKREDLIRRLNSGVLDVLVANDVFKEGVDAPEIRSVINAAGGKSLIPTLQRVGRGSRVIPGEKNHFEIYDYWDRGQRWLANHSRARRRAYQRYGYTVIMQ